MLGSKLKLRIQIWETDQVQNKFDFALNLEAIYNTHDIIYYWNICCIQYARTENYLWTASIICGHLSLDCVPNDDESGLADEVTNWHRNILCDILAHNLQIIQIYISC